MYEAITGFARSQTLTHQVTHSLLKNFGGASDFNSNIEAVERSNKILKGCLVTTKQPYGYLLDYIGESNVTTVRQVI